MLPSSAAFILSLLASTVVAVPKPDTAVSKVGSALEASEVVARSLNEEIHALEKRQTCRGNVDCRNMPPMAFGRSICRNEICVYGELFSSLGLSAASVAIADVAQRPSLYEWLHLQCLHPSVPNQHGDPS
jgi:hypothetical protein